MQVDALWPVRNPPRHAFYLSDSQPAATRGEKRMDISFTSVALPGALTAPMAGNGNDHRVGNEMVCESAIPTQRLGGFE